MLTPYLQSLRDLCGISELSVGEKSGPSTTIVVSSESFYIPLEGVIDISAELDRLTKLIEDESAIISRLEKRLGSKNYVERAPAHIVQESRDSLLLSQQKVTKLQHAKHSLEQI